MINIKKISFVSFFSSQKFISSIKTSSFNLQVKSMNMDSHVISKVKVEETENESQQASSYVTYVLTHLTFL